MSEYYNHYDCNHFRAFDDGIAVDTYCKLHKRWCIEDEPCCEDYDEIEDAMYPRGEIDDD